MDAVRDTELEIPVLLGAFCMMRRGKICALTPNDMQGDVIHVHHSLVLGTDKEWHLKAPKSGSSDRYISAPLPSGTIPLPSVTLWVFQMLTSCREVAGKLTLC